MPTRYCLLLDASLGSANAKNGDFDSKSDQNGKLYFGTWVSPDNQALSQPDNQTMSVLPGDSVSFAVKISGTSNEAMNAAVKWLAVTVNDTSDDVSKVDSPFQLANGGVWPLMIASSSPKIALEFASYDVHGGPDPNGIYLGLPYQQVQNAGAFEVVVAVEVVGKMANGADAWCQLSHDPEIDNGTK